jgi:D-3-phosphoglycerate dehydrogenase
MNIGIPDDYVDMVRSLDCFARLAGHDVSIWNDACRDVEVLAKRMRDIEALVLLRERTVLPDALLARLTKLRMITINGPHPNFSLEACTAGGILVCAGHGRRSYATAELTWGLVISAVRHIPQEMARLRGGAWQGQIGTVLRGRTLGVIGYGRIGKVVASYGKAFGMKVLVWSRDRGQREARDDGLEVCPDRESLFERSDVVSLHIRLVPETRGFVRASDLARMKPTSVLVNTSRSGLIEPGALVGALRQGRPGHAAIDVYESEPVFGADHPLLKLDNVICTPHLGYFERDQMEAYYSDQFDRVLAYAAGAPVDVENPQVSQRTV